MSSHPSHDYDWLANMTSWDDDAQQFYERSLGLIENGFDQGKRPSALYLASDLPTQSPVQTDPYDVEPNPMSSRVRFRLLQPLDPTDPRPIRTT